MKMNLTRAFLGAAFLAVMVLTNACKKSQTEYFNYVNKEQRFNGTTMEYLRAQPQGNYDSLLKVLDLYPALQDSLDNQAITLFAPKNESFEAAFRYLNQKRANEGKAPVYITTAEPIGLAAMMCWYMIRGNQLSDKYDQDVDGRDFPCIVTGDLMHLSYRKLNSSGFVSGGPGVVEFSVTYNQVNRDWWVTTQTDAINIKTKNGIVNVLTPLHVFGFDAFIYTLNN